MTYSFEQEKNKKALRYTFIVCFSLFILFFIIRWSNVPPTITTTDLMEINLGNNIDGNGDEQPIVQGNKTKENIQEEVKEEKNIQETPPPLKPEETEDKEAAPLVSSKKKTTITEEKNKKPKLLYTGTEKGKNGNDVNDNGYKYQGNHSSNGDNNDPNGNKDSYGNTPGGKIGGPKVIKGNRRIIQQYKFEGDLNKATIYAIIRVSPDGIGVFSGFDKGSTERSSAYSNAISKYLQKIQFNKSAESSLVTVEFIFDIR